MCRCRPSVSSNNFTTLYFTKSRRSGLISDSTGGCATLELIGNFTNFLPFSAHGLTSIGFPSVFPLSFRFADTTDLHHCQDLRNPALAFNILVTALIFLVLRPKPIVAFWSLVCIGFWHITLFSQPRDNPPPLDEAFGSFLPALFIAYGFWRVAWRFTLPAFRNAPIEASVWYLASFWPGVLTNIIEHSLPIDRLVASDIRERPGALTALIVIVIIVLVIVINQIRVIRKTGWLPHYLGWYLVGGLTVVVLSQLPGLQFRLHHYIIATVLMPGTAFPTRLSAIYQGFLLGLFLNGAAAFGFDSILQTAADVSIAFNFSIWVKSFGIPSHTLFDFTAPSGCRHRYRTPVLQHQLYQFRQVYYIAFESDHLLERDYRHGRLGRVRAPHRRRGKIYRSSAQLFPNISPSRYPSLLPVGCESFERLLCHHSVSLTVVISSSRVADSLATSPCQRLCGQTAHGSIRCLDHLDHLNSLRLEH